MSTLICSSGGFFRRMQEAGLQFDSSDFLMGKQNGASQVLNKQSGFKASWSLEITRASGEAGDIYEPSCKCLSQQQGNRQQHLLAVQGAAALPGLLMR